MNDLLQRIDAALSDPALGAAWDYEADGGHVTSYSAQQTRIPVLVGALLKQRDMLRVTSEAGLPLWARSVTNVLYLEKELEAFRQKHPNPPASRMDLLRVQLEIAGLIVTA